MEPDKIIEAIHSLEVNLIERIHIQTCVMEVTNERLDTLCIAVDRYRVILYGNDDGDRKGLVAQMDEIQKTEKGRKWTMRTVTASFVALLGTFVWDLFHG